MATENRGWRDGLQPETIDAIEVAIENWRYLCDYERTQPKLAETLRCLQVIEANSSDLMDRLEQLSPIARGALFDLDTDANLQKRYREHFPVDDLRGLPRAPVIRDRNLVRDTKANLRDLLQIVVASQRYLQDLSELEESEGQGSGSVPGRVSDQWVVKTQGDRLESLQFRKPKDKFAAHVIIALAAEDAKTGASSWSGKSVLERKLDQISLCENFGSGHNWHRVTQDRKQIREQALRQMAIDKSWDEARAQVVAGNADRDAENDS